MTKKSLPYLHHILECTLKILNYTDGIKKDEFLDDTLIQDGEIRNLEIIGEATKNLDQSFREKYPDVDWKKIAGLRDKLIHNYMGVDMMSVWELIKNILPDFEQRIRLIINKEEAPD